MPPKKSKKISLNEFLGDGALGSWADEMDALPSAPAMRTDEEMGRDRYTRKDDFLSSRSERTAGPPREDLPLPTAPPYTAFIGNLAFDLTEKELEDFFGSSKAKSVKIIRDKDDKPKGFGYIEFVDLDTLKEAIAKSGSDFSGRTIRVSVAEPPKERIGGGRDEDDAKFDNPWRRDGPLPDRDSRDSRDGPRRRFDSTNERLPSVAEGAEQWRSNKPRGPLPEPEGPSFRRKTSGFASTDTPTGAADKEESWTMGSKFKPSAPADEQGSGSKFGSLRGRGEPSRDSAAADESQWRRSRPSNTSPTSSTPPTPQLGRRKLELLPRSGTASASPSPLSSPKIGPTTTGSSSRANPFGAAKPVDVSSKEKEVVERLEKDKETTKERLVQHPMSRTSSRSGVERGSLQPRTRSPPPASGAAPAAASPTAPQAPAAPKVSTAPKVQPSISFANVASRKENASETNGIEPSVEQEA